MNGIQSGHESRPGRRTNRHHIMRIENDSVVSESVDVGRMDLVTAVKAQVIPALLT